MDCCLELRGISKVSLGLFKKESVLYVFILPTEVRFPVMVLSEVLFFGMLSQFYFMVVLFIRPKKINEKVFCVFDVTVGKLYFLLVW